MKAYGNLYFKKDHFTEEGWKWLKDQLKAPQKKFNDKTSTVDFIVIGVWK